MTFVEMQKLRDNENSPSSCSGHAKESSEKEQCSGSDNPSAPLFTSGKPGCDELEINSTKQQPEFVPTPQQGPPISPAPAQVIPQSGSKSVIPHIPTEIWLKIYGYLLAPQFIPVIAAVDGQLSSLVDGVPRNLFFDKASHLEMMKTHAVAFKGLLPRPVLFNKDTDVLLLLNQASVVFLSEKMVGLHRTCRPPVQFLAIEYFGYKIINMADQISVLVTLLRTVKTVFLVCSRKLFDRYAYMRRPKHQQESFDPHVAARWKSTVERYLLYRFERVKTGWNKVEARGGMVKNKWQLPEVKAVADKREILDPTFAEMPGINRGDSV